MLRAVVTSQHEQPVDEVAQTGDVGEDRFDRGAFRVIRRARVEVLEAEPQRGERRAELVRRVGDELLLGIEQPGDLGRHPIEGELEVLELRRPASLGHARREVAAGDAVGRVLEPAHAAASRCGRAPSRRS